VTITPDDSKVAVAELGLALMLAAARWIPDGDKCVRSGSWNEDGYSRTGIGLSGRTCGIVGLGTIGNYVAERAEAFGMEILYYCPNEKNDSPYLYQKNLLELASSSDFLVLCCPNTSETKNLINTEILNAL
jgi:lactate dehydrogenase-like 2-hydroxyacid dehydrogenase